MYHPPADWWPTAIIWFLLWWEGRLAQGGQLGRKELLSLNRGTSALLKYML